MTRSDRKRLKGKEEKSMITKKLKFKKVQIYVFNEESGNFEKVLTKVVNSKIKDNAIIGEYAIENNIDVSLIHVTSEIITRCYKMSEQDFIEHATEVNE